MLKLASFAFLTALAAAQTATNPFDKAPPNVDDALKTRVTEFYQDHIDGKFRKAEQLVAEDSKDAFYDDIGCRRLHDSNWSRRPKDGKDEGREASHCSSLPSNTLRICRE